MVNGGLKECARDDGIVGSIPDLREVVERQGEDIGKSRREDNGLLCVSWSRQDNSDAERR